MRVRNSLAPLLVTALFAFNLSACRLDRPLLRLYGSDDDKKAPTTPVKAPDKKTADDKGKEKKPEPGQKGCSLKSRPALPRERLIFDELGNLDKEIATLLELPENQDPADTNALRKRIYQYVTKLDGVAFDGPKGRDFTEELIAFPVQKSPKPAVIADQEAKKEAENKTEKEQPEVTSESPNEPEPITLKPAITAFVNFKSAFEFVKKQLHDFPELKELDPEKFALSFYRLPDGVARLAAYQAMFNQLAVKDTDGNVGPLNKNPQAALAMANQVGTDPRGAEMFLAFKSAYDFALHPSKPYGEMTDEESLTFAKQQGCIADAPAASAPKP